MRRSALIGTLLGLVASGCFGGDGERSASPAGDITSEPSPTSSLTAPGNRRTKVPAVSREGYAREVEEAFRTLREEGLLVAVSPPDEMSQAKHLPLGSSFGMPLVVDQRPDAGRTVKTGSVVRLVVVPAGPVLLPRPPPESAVPELTGLTLREALRRIDAAGLYWWTMLPFLPPTDGPGFLDAYRVTSQDPSAGDLGSRVTLDVAPAR